MPVNNYGNRVDGTGKNPFTGEDEEPQAIKDPSKERVISISGVMDKYLQEREKKSISLTDAEVQAADIQQEAKKKEISISGVMNKYKASNPLPPPEGGKPIPIAVRQAYLEKTGSEAPAYYPEEESSLKKWMDFGLDVGLFVLSAATAAAAGATGVGVPLAAAALYTGGKALGRLIDNKPSEPTLTESITGETYNEPVRAIVDFAETATMTVPIPLKGAAKKLLQWTPTKKLTQKAEPIGEWVWDNVVVPPFTAKILPGEGRKSIAEVLQPGVERLAKSANQKFRQASRTIRKAEIMKAKVTNIGRVISEDLPNLKPSERYEFLKGLRGTSPSELTSSKAKALMWKADNLMQEARLDNLYETHFREALSKQLTKPIEAAESVYDPKDLLAFMTETEKGLAEGAKPRKIEQLMRSVIEDPAADDELKTFMKDMWSASAKTPMAVADASRLASTTYMTEKLVNNKGLVSNVMKPGYIKSSWGKLAGKYVPRDVEFQLQDISKLPRIARGVYQKWFLSPWKMSKTIMRPAYHARNLLSNAMLNDWGGLPIYRVDIYSKALRGMRKGSPEWKEFIHQTGLGGSFTQNDIYQLSAGLDYGANILDKSYKIFDQIAKPAKTLQNAEENWFKFAKFLHNKELGMGNSEAALDSMKWLMNFGEVTAPLGQVRKYAVPFATWYSKSIPLMVETAVKHPLRFGKWIMFGAALQNQALQQVGLSEEEWQHVEKNLPEYIKKGVFLLAPWRDEQDRLNLINLTYIIPGIGDVNELWNTMTPSMGGGGGLTLPNPLIGITTALASKEKYSGAPLYYDWEEPSVKFAKSFSYIWEQLMPAIAPGGTDWNMMWKTATEQEGALSSEAALGSLLGIKATPVDPAMNARRKRAVRKIYSSELKQQMQKELKSARGDERKINQILNRYRALKLDVMNY